MILPAGINAEGSTEKMIGEEEEANQDHCTALEMVKGETRLGKMYRVDFHVRLNIAESNFQNSKKIVYFELIIHKGHLSSPARKSVS